MTSIEDLVSRYVAVWNEPDPARRRQCIARLWAEDGAHFTPSLEVRGYEAIEARVASAHERFVRTQGYVFSAAYQGAGHHDAITFSWEMRPAGGGPVARSRLSVTFEVAKTDHVFVAPTPQTNQLATFGANSLSLVGYDTSASTIRAGDKLTVTLYWKAGNKMDKPYTVFVHLLDKGSQVAAQRDAQPLNGARPTQTWVTGEYIADEYGLDVKPETGAGEYLIEIGWYDGGDPAFTRLQAFDERDNPIGDRVILKTGVAVR